MASADPLLSFKGGSKLEQTAIVLLPRKVMRKMLPIVSVA